MRHLVWIVCAAAFASCTPATSVEADLPLGFLSVSDQKADGDWGYALECKTVPSYPGLSRPEIFISLNGLTLRLVDKATGFEKVFPIGVGAINDKSGETTYGESLTYYPVLRTGSGNFTLYTSKIQPCKIWWTDSETGEKLPVFAGLPFMSFWGNYGIHGPIDNYRASNGGNLRRGFVSHGCVRMESADVLEVYARIRGVSQVPVHVQREPERTAQGPRVDVSNRWIGSECGSDADCNYTGGLCKMNRFSGRGFCTARCTRYCADRAGYPTTFCIDDPDDSSLGMCTFKISSQGPDCRAADHFVAARQSRHGQSWVRSTVCVPGSPGWIGDHCFADADCKLGTRCAGASGASPGICTQPCSLYCPDQPGWPVTFCSQVDALGSGGSCLRRCTPASNASECPANSDCVERSRNNQSWTKRFVCVPR